MSRSLGSESDDEWLDAEEYEPASSPTSPAVSSPEYAEKQTITERPSAAASRPSQLEESLPSKRVSRTLPEAALIRPSELAPDVGDSRFYTVPHPSKHTLSMSSGRWSSSGAEPKIYKRSNSDSIGRSNISREISTDEKEIRVDGADTKSKPSDDSVKNLDTGEYMTLEKASISPPLLTFQKFSASSAALSDLDPTPELVDPDVVQQRKSTTGWLGKVFSSPGLDTEPLPKFDVRVRTHKNPIRKLSSLKRVQEINDHKGPVWCMKFSLDGSFLASGGQDSIVRVWTVIGSDEDKKHSTRLREEGKIPADSITPPEVGNMRKPSAELPYSFRDIINHVPCRCYSGHKSDIIALAWSRANFLLSASMDRTVMLWHVSRQKCLCLFQHSDFVTSVAFHPKEDTIFLSGSFDKKIRLWNILDHKVVDWAQTPTMVTSATFSPSGDKCVAGLFNGQCIFYQTNGLKYFTQVDCRNRRGKYSKGRKVTGLSFSPNGKYLLVTTNDSRIRLFDMDDFSMVQKFKGLENGQLQIHATFNEDGGSIICGSDDQHVYIWDTSIDVITKAGRSPSDRNDSYEFFKVAQEIVTVALFAPKDSISASQRASDVRDAHLNMLSGVIEDESEKQSIRQIIVTADYNGEITILENRGEPDTNR
eukprot:191090_1